MTSIYRPPAVDELQAFYGDLVFQTDWYYCVREHLGKIAQRLHWGLKEGIPAVRHVPANFHPKYLGQPQKAFQQKEWRLEEARMMLAKEYGFASWESVEALRDEAYDDVFESAVNFLVNGELPRLQRALSEYPELVEKRSKYGHGAMLLHYTASSGVELWRQQVPHNLVEITKLLLDSGADPKAGMHIYGEELDALALLKSSEHPFEAGIGQELVDLLQ